MGRIETTRSAKPPHSRKALETGFPGRRHRLQHASQTPSQPKGIGDMSASGVLGKGGIFSQPPSQPKGIGDRDSPWGSGLPQSFSQTPSQPKGVGDPLRRPGCQTIPSQPTPLTAERHWRLKLDKDSLLHNIISQTPSQPKGIGELAVRTVTVQGCHAQPNPLTAERHWKRGDHTSSTQMRGLQLNPLTAERHWRLTPGRERGI